MTKRIVLIAILLLGLMSAAATVMAREALLEGERTTNRRGVSADEMPALRALLGRSERRAAGLSGLFGLSAAAQSDDNANDNGDDDNANDNGDDDDNANDNGDDDDNANDNGDDDDNANDNDDDDDDDDDDDNDNGEEHNDKGGD